jgi:O-antigen/teichoic acid export membrane protein
MQPAPISINIFKNSVWNLFLFAIQGITGIVMSILIARYLGAELMGEYSYITWLIGIISLVISFGLPNAITKFLSELIGSEGETHANLIYSTLLQLQFIIALAVSIILILLFYCNLLPDRKDYYLIAFISLIPMCMSAFLAAAFQGLQNFRIISLVGSCLSLLQTALVVLFIKLDAGVMGLIAIPLIGGLIQTLILVKNTNLAFDFTGWLKIPKTIRDNVARYSLHVYWTILLSMIVWQKSEIFFLRIYSTSAAIAFYSIAFNIVLLLTSLASLFAAVIFPVLSNFHGAGYTEGVQNIYAKSIKAVVIFYLPLCICFIATAKPLILLMYSSEYVAVYPLLIILVVSILFSALGIIFANVILAVNRSDIQAKYVTLQAVVNVVLDLALIPQFGATGAAVANSAIRIASFFVWLWIVQRQLGFSFPLREVSLCILPNIPLAVILWAVLNYYPSSMGIVSVFLVALLFYPIFLLLFQTVTSDDIRIAKEVATILPAPYEKAVSGFVDKLPMRKE